MNNKTDKCPVCRAKIRNNTCPVCGFCRLSRESVIRKFREYFSFFESFEKLNQFGYEFDRAFEKNRHDDWYKFKGKLADIESKIDDVHVLLRNYILDCVKSILNDLRYASDSEIKSVFGEVECGDAVRRLAKEDDADDVFNCWVYNSILKNGKIGTDEELIEKLNELFGEIHKQSEKNKKIS